LTLRDLEDTCTWFGQQASAYSSQFCFKLVALPPRAPDVFLNRPMIYHPANEVETKIAGILVRPWAAGAGVCKISAQTAGQPEASD